MTANVFGKSLTRVLELPASVNNVVRVHLLCIAFLGECLRERNR